MIPSLTTKKSENGRKRNMRKIENAVKSLEHSPGPSSQSKCIGFKLKNLKLLLTLFSSSAAFYLFDAGFAHSMSNLRGIGLR